MSSAGHKGKIWTWRWKTQSNLILMQLSQRIITFWWKKKKKKSAFIDPDACCFLSPGLPKNNKPFCPPNNFLERLSSSATAFTFLPCGWNLVPLWFELTKITAQFTLSAWKTYLLGQANPWGSSVETSAVTPRKDYNLLFLVLQISLYKSPTHSRQQLCKNLIYFFCF